MAVKKKMNDQYFKTFCLLVGMFDYLKENFPKFAEGWQLTKLEKKEYHTADGAITRLVESIVNRLDKKYLSEALPVLKKLKIDVRTQIQNDARLTIWSNAWEHSCRNCDLKNWKACQNRKAYLEEGLPQVTGKEGDCPYRYAEEQKQVG